MPRAYDMKRRRVTTCIECKRRKQKCNRQSPCQHCLSRGTPEKCLFVSTQSPATASNSGPDITSPDTSRQQLVGARPASSISSRSDQASHEPPTPDPLSHIGYQLGRNHNGQLHVVDELQATVATNPQYMRPSKYNLYPSRIGKDKWAQYCQLSSTLPDQQVIRHLIDVFFAEANWYFTVLDRYYFDAAHRAWLMSCSDISSSSSKQAFSSDDVFFPALLQQVLAMAIHFVPEQSAVANLMIRLGLSPTDNLSQTYSDAGEATIDLLGRHHHSIIAVQADLMRCAWLKNSGHGARAWYSLGSAIRQAQDIGLHLEPAASQSGEDGAEYLCTAWLNEHKRRLWACLFSWESHMALQLGRVCTIHARDCTTSMLIQTDLPEDPSRTLFRPSSAEEKPSTSSSQMVKYTTALMIQNLMALRAFDSNMKNYSLITATHNEVNDLLQTLPPCMRIDSPDTSWDVVHPDTVLHRLQIGTIINSFLLSLHRAHVRSHVESFDAAVAAAMNVMDYSQALFVRTSKHQHKTFTLIFYTIDAGILAAAMMQSLRPGDVRYQSIWRCLDTAIKRLAILGRRNIAAVAGHKALSNCLWKLSLLEHTPKETLGDRQQQLLRSIPQEQQQHSLPDQQPNAPVDSDTPFDLPNVNTLQEDPDIWDFLPRIDDSEDLLTAMTTDTGFTSAWLEQSLENLSSWD